jgi:hypothetical protein
MLNGSLRRGIRHRELAISCWQGIGPATFGLLVTGLTLLLILLYAGVITVAP